jgi:hypothetical protein
MARQGKTAAANKGNPTDEAELNKNPRVADDMTEPEAEGEAYDTFEAKIEAQSCNGPMAAIVEAAVTPEFEVLEEIERESFEAAGTAAVTFAERFRQFTNESAACAKEIVDSGYAFAGEIRHAKSPVAAAGLQIDFARSVYIRLLGHFMRLSEFYWSALRHACTNAEKGPAKAS